MPMKESFYNISDLQICVRQWGTQPSIILLHGWLDQSAAWDPVADYLHKKGYSIAIPDQRGHGCSDHAPKSSHYHFPDYVCDLALLHKQLSDQPIQLIGHSMGAMCIMRLLESFKVKGATIVSAGKTH